MKYIIGNNARKFLSLATGEEKHNSGILLSKKLNALIATDGIRIHAMKNDAELEVVVSPLENGKMMLFGEANDFPNVRHALQQMSTEMEDASLILDGKLLKEAISFLDNGPVRFSIVTNADGTRDAIKLQGEVSNTPSYALIMALDVRHVSFERWEPKHTDDAEEVTA